MKKISVALAAYNGEKFIREQLESVLSQLSNDDEVIISDDFPEGETRKIVEEMAENDGRIKYFKGPGKGVIANFENAISLCTGDYIFLCDQDDVWLPDKVESVRAELDKGVTLVLHDCMVTDENLKITQTSFFNFHGTKIGYVNNIIKNCFMGCCMAFNADLKKVILPFPDNLPMHDQWIGLAAVKTGKVKKLDKPLLLYRRHGGNVTGGKSKLIPKLKRRKNIISAMRTIKTN